MEEPPHGHKAPIPGPGRLKAALREARLEAAERSEVIADLRGAELARLDLLQESLADVFAQIPPEIDLFDTGLVPGPTPRLFIDMLGFVEMARDRRTYRFLRETRHGRVTMIETDDLDRITAEVTAYVARRLVEREKALGADSLPLPGARRREEPRATRPAQATAVASPQPPPAQTPSSPAAHGLADGSWLRIATNLLALVFVILLTLFLIVIAAHEWQLYR